MANGLFGGGDGTPENPYLIEDALDLQMVSTKNITYPYYCYKVTSDIDMKGKTFQPIGDTSAGPPYQGEFDGDFYKVRNVNIVVDDEYSYSSFFGLLAGAIIKKLSIVDAKVSGSAANKALFAGNLTNSGGPWFENRGTLIENCSITGEVDGDDYSAGFAVFNFSSVISKCYCDAKIKGQMVGGFVRSNYGTIENCYAEGEIQSANATEYLSAGTFAYESSGSISNCYSAVAINNYAPSTSEMGLFLLNDGGTIVNCYADYEKGVTNQEWTPNEWYFSEGKKFVRGTDKKLYNLLQSQQPINWGTGATFYEARPVDGAQWQEYWQEVTPRTNSEARSTEQMQTKATFAGWDFNNVWRIDEGRDYPRLMFEPIRCVAFPLSTLKVNAK